MPDGEQTDILFVTCPHCGKQSHTRRSNIGKRAKCKCGRSFIVAERRTRTCPDCGQTNHERATRCSVCDGDLVLASIYRERDSANVVAEYETHQEIEDTVYAWYHQRRWRRVGRWLLVVSLPFAIYAAFEFVCYGRSGKLPTVKQIERDMRVWSLEEQRTVLRGRPLTEIPFTSDASRMLIRQPDFSLYLDDDKRIVAFSSSLLDRAEGYEDRLPVDFESIRRHWLGIGQSSEADGDDDVYRRALLLRDFSMRYLCRDDLDPRDDPVARRFEGDDGLSRSYLWTHDRLSFELTIQFFVQPPYADTTTQRARYCLYIVQSRDW